MIFFFFLAGESISEPLQNGAGSSETIPPGTSSNARKQSGNKLARISFDDYITTWTGIATSKARSDMKNPCKFTVIISPIGIWHLTFNISIFFMFIACIYWLLQ